jgi:hypothetical protein
MDLKQLTKDALNDFPNTDSAYLCLRRNRADTVFPESGFVTQESGNTFLYKANIFTVLTGGDVGSCQQYNSVDAIVDDGWLID